MATKLTTKSVTALKPRTARYWINDTELPGFRVSVTPSGVKSFAVRLRSRGGRKNRTDSMQVLGRLGTLTVDEARAKARELLSRATLGEDVALGRREDRAAETVAELATLFLEARTGKIKDSTLTEYQRLFDVEITPKMGTRSARDLSRRDVARVHNARRESPYIANRIVTLLGALYVWARTQGFVPEDVHPTRGLELFPEESRERYLTQEETLRLGASLRTAEKSGVPMDHTRAALQAKRQKERAKQPLKRKFKKPRTPKEPKEPKVSPSNPYAIAAIRFLLLTGWREQEALTLRWDTLDLEQGRARLPDTKTGLSWRDLGGGAVQLLLELSRMEGSPYVFPGTKPGKPLSDIKHVWYAVRDHAKLTGLRIHDLRHNFASVGAQGGTSLLVLGAVLGHREVATTKKYAHLGESPAKLAADEISAKIGAMMDGKKSEDDTTKVLPLRA
ncbi:MAG: tyrosine-type recombinase/integrase [Gemmatimonadaceae bacterium]